MSILYDPVNQQPFVNVSSYYLRSTASELAQLYHHHKPDNTLAEVAAGNLSTLVLMDYQCAMML